MFYAILGGLIYAAWLLVPLVAIALIVRWRLSSWLGGGLVIMSIVLACPAYLGLMV